MVSDDRKKRIGKNLQRLRKEAGYKSAKAFADAANINPGTYTSYEQGERSFSYDTAWDMADVLHVTLDELGGRKFDARRFADPRQEKMNMAYDSLSDVEKGTISGVVQSYARDASRRIEKDGPEIAGNQTAV